jgi:hypothetical protein
MSFFSPFWGYSFGSSPFFHSPYSIADDLAIAENDLRREFVESLEDDQSQTLGSTSFTKQVKSIRDENGLRSVETRSYTNLNGDKIHTERRRLNDQSYEKTTRRLASTGKEEVYENLKGDQKDKFLQDWSSAGGNQGLFLLDSNQQQQQQQQSTNQAKMLEQQEGGAKQGVGDVSTTTASTTNKQPSQQQQSETKIDQA